MGPHGTHYRHFGIYHKLNRSLPSLLLLCPCSRLVCVAASPMLSTTLMPSVVAPSPTTLTIPFLRICRASCLGSLELGCLRHGWLFVTLQFLFDHL